MSFEIPQNTEVKSGKEKFGREESWRVMEEFIKKLEAAAKQENFAVISKMEHKDDKSTKTKSEELYKFYGKRFKPEENMDPMQHEIALRNKIVDTWIGRDEKGELTTVLQTQLIDLPRKEGEEREAVFTTWYVSSDPEYKGTSIIRELFIRSLKESLERAKNNSITLKGIIGETEPEVEKLFNRYDVKRLYYKDSKGRIVEAPYEAPPEDESNKGAPAHFMARFFDGREETNRDEFSRLVEGIHAQYTRPEYFTAEYLKFAMEFYGEEGNPDWVTDKRASRYHQSYIKKAEKIRQKLADKLKNADKGRLFMMSERERREREEKGEKIIEWEA